jgi:hypothetical protein
MPIPDKVAPRPWPPAVRKFVEWEQEKAYRRLSDQMGLGGDPAAAFSRLSRGVPTAEVIAPMRFKDAMPGFLTDEQWAEFDAVVAQQYPHYAGLEAPTSYESVASYVVLDMTFGALRGVWAASTTPEPYLASLPSGDVNARIRNERATGATVIFFEQGLMRFLYDFGQLIAWASPPISPAELNEDEALVHLPRSYQMPEIASVSFMDSLYAYAVSGTPLDTPTPFPKPEHNMFLASILVTLMERFVMAHELAHLTLGHVPKTPTHELEYEADVQGLMTLTAQAHTSNLSWGLTYWACDLTLTCFHILDFALSVLAFGGNRPSWSCPTHPDALSRRQRFRTKLGELVPDAPYASLAAANLLCGMSDAIIQRLWAFVVAPLLLAHQQGVRPARLWEDRIRDCFRPI